MLLFGLLGHPSSLSSRCAVAMNTMHIHVVYIGVSQNFCHCSCGYVFRIITVCAYLWVCFLHYNYSVCLFYLCGVSNSSMPFDSESLHPFTPHLQHMNDVVTIYTKQSTQIKLVVAGGAVHTLHSSHMYLIIKDVNNIYT